MALPSPRRLDRLFSPYGLASETPVRVWGTDAGASIARLPAREAFVDRGPPRLLCLAGGPSMLVVVREVHGHDGHLDGFAVPWSLVRSVSRARHLASDLVTLEVAGRPALRAHVAAHLLLPGNRAAVRALCALADAARSAAAPRAAEPAGRPTASAPESDTRPIQ